MYIKGLVERSESKGRRVRGASRIGKTKMAQSLFPNAFVTVQNEGKEPDLRGFERGFHKCVVIDQVQTPQFILDNRALLQANDEDHKLAVTQSLSFSYELFLHGIPFILTFDLDAEGWDMFSDGATGSNWLRENCVCIDLGHEPTYDKDAMADAPVDVEFHRQSVAD